MFVYKRRLSKAIGLTVILKRIGNEFKKKLSKFKNN
jgi:hypothetical protein